RLLSCAAGRVRVRSRRPGTTSATTRCACSTCHVNPLVPQLQLPADSDAGRVPEPGRPERYPATPWATARLYRPFVAAAIASGLAGAALGASMIVGAVPLSVALELHVSLQLLGWCGLLILGMAMHVVPRFYGNVPIWYPWQ